MFCDLADSTVLAGRLDTDDLREVIRSYQATAAEVVQRFEGHITQYPMSVYRVRGRVEADETDPLL